MARVYRVVVIVDLLHRYLNLVLQMRRKLKEWCLRLCLWLCGWCLFFFDHRIHGRRRLDGCVSLSGFRDTQRSSQDTIDSSEEPEANMSPKNFQWRKNRISLVGVAYAISRSNKCAINQDGYNFFQFFFSLEILTFFFLWQLFDAVEKALDQRRARVNFEEFH